MAAHRRRRTRPHHTFARFAAALAVVFVLGGAVDAGAESTSHPVLVALPTSAATSAQDAVLNAMACASPNSCVEVGSFVARGDNEPLLASQTGYAVSTVEPTLPSNAVASRAASSGPVTELLGAACPALGSCVAVGTYETATSPPSYAAMIVQQDGATWSAGVTATLPKDAVSSHQVASLDAISCNSVGNCEAVGSYTASSGNVEPLAIQEAAGIWGAPQKPDLPTGAIASEQLAALYSISCPSFGNCVAAGTYVNASQSAPMALTEVDDAWGAAATATAVALPAGAATVGADSALNAITCQSVGNCTAVGQYDVAGGVAPMAATESAGTWSPATSVAVPTIPDATGEAVASLAAVSCLTATSCEAVGSYGTVSETETKLLPAVTTESDGEWSTATTGDVPKAPAMKGSDASDAAIACFGAGACLLGGAYDTASGVVPFLWTPTTVPGAPSEVVAAVGNGKLTISWSAPTYNGLSPIVSYNVVAIPGDETCVTTGLSCKLTGLVDETHYAITVTATNAVGPSAPARLTATPAARPSAPGVSAVHARTDGFQLIIRPPANNGGAPVLTYQYSLNGGTRWIARATGTTSRILDITGLPSAHAYRLTVRAVNVIGPGKGSPVRRVRTA